MPRAKYKYTTQVFIDAIPQTGGAISLIAKSVGCDWHTAKKWIDEHPTVKRAFEAERNRITDKARHNVVTAIVNDGDLQTSKWWLQVMAEEFKPKQEIDIKGYPAVVFQGLDESLDDQ